MGHSDYDLDKVFMELDVHCRVNGRYGFTIPYLIKTSRNKQENLDINRFLTELKQGKQKYFMLHCRDLKEVIIGLHKSSEHAPLHMHPNFGNLHFDEDKIGRFDNFEDLSNHFKDKYLPIIKQGKFSKNIDTLDWE